MNKPTISIIVAVWPHNEIWKNNQLLWNIPTDLKRFKDLTTGHPIIMWRKTFESLPKKYRPLPNRTNIVLNNDSSFHNDGIIICNNIPDAIAKASEIDPNEIFIIWWWMIFRQTLEIADKIYLTKVEWEFDADIFFPDYSMFNKIISKQDLEDNWYRLSFLELTK